MDYAAVKSLKQTIVRLLKSSGQVSLVPSFPEIEAVVKLAELLLTELEDLYISRCRKPKIKVAADIYSSQVSEASSKLEDAIDSLVTKQFRSQSDKEGSTSCVDLQELRHEVNFFLETFGGKRAFKRIERLSSDHSKFEEEFVAVRKDFWTPRILGLHNQVSQLRHMLMQETPDRLVIPIVGMVGSGKTTLARQIFEDPLVASHFQSRVWITVGRNSIKSEVQDYVLDGAGDHYTSPVVSLIHRTALGLTVATYMTREKCLIVLDDVWDTELIHILKLYYYEMGYRVLLTTRRGEVARNAESHLGGETYKMLFLSEKESWSLFCIVFGCLKYKGPQFLNDDDESRELSAKVLADLRSHELENLGKKIVQNCEGLPLAIINVAKHLAEAANMTQEYWKQVAERKISVFTDPEVIKTLYESYDNLRPNTKQFFLYLGGFPHDQDISASKIILLWHAEGFLGPKRRIMNGAAMKLLCELVSDNIVLGRQQSSINGLKTCAIHYIFQDFLANIARKEKFFQIGKVLTDTFTEDIKDQRRLCIHNNVLLAIKHELNKMESPTLIRSLLYLGQYHQYPVKIKSGLWLLRVLDALTIRFYSFPNEVLNFIHLMHLAITFDGMLPPSISKLWNLRHLIVSRHVNIKSSGTAQSYLPMEIWKMKELRHLQVVGGALPDPCGAILPKLEILLDTSTCSCTKEVFKGIPNIKKLGIRIELSLDSDEHLSFPDHLVHLNELRLLKCVVVNPYTGSRVVAPPPSNDIFPSHIRKLTLSGFGYPWEGVYMRMIAALPELEVLKLRNYAFRGTQWEIYDGNFPKLRILILEDTDLVDWRAKSRPFRNLQQLKVRDCYKLRELPDGINECKRLEAIELVDVRPSLVATVHEMLQGQQHTQVQVRRSWEEKLKT